MVPVLCISWQHPVTSLKVWVREIIQLLLLLLWFLCYILPINSLHLYRKFPSPILSVQFRVFSRQWVMDRRNGQWIDFTILQALHSKAIFYYYFMPTSKSTHVMQVDRVHMCMSSSLSNYDMESVAIIYDRWQTQYQAKMSFQCKPDLL